MGIKNILINRVSDNSLIFSLESLVDIEEGEIEVFVENKDEYIKVN